MQAYVPQTAPQGLQTWTKSHKKATVFKMDTVMESDHFSSERNTFSLVHLTTNTALAFIARPAVMRQVNTALSMIVILHF